MDITNVVDKFPLVGTSVMFTSFVRRQTKESNFSHWTISDNLILQRIQLAAQAKHYTTSYRPGVIQVAIDVFPGEFYSGVIKLIEGIKLVGEYKVRVSGEEPRTSIYVRRLQKIVPRQYIKKQEAVAVDIILYHHTVLLEKNENETEADWEIVSINARTTYEPQPINPITLMHNHFGSDGGTDTQMNSEQFVYKLREAFQYWKDKALLAPGDFNG